MPVDGHQNAHFHEASYGFVALKSPIKNQSEKPLNPMKSISASDEIHRILPLGLTLTEARAWYVNRVVIPQLRWPLVALFGGFVIFLSMLTELGQLLQQNLTTHMIVHDSLLLAAGFLFAYAANSLMELASHLSDWLWRVRHLFYRKCLVGRRLNILTFGAAGSLISYWYIPAHFNAAILNFDSAIEMRLTLVLAGGLIFLGAGVLSRRQKLIALVVVGKMLGLYGMFLLLLPSGVYSIYPGYEQVYAGASLLFLMLILDFTIMPLWLYNYFGKSSGSNPLSDNSSID
jgi:hypothetical protein